jgi:hypothetical protein
MGRNLRWSIIAASEDQHLAATAFLRIPSVRVLHRVAFPAAASPVPNRRRVAARPQTSAREKIMISASRKLTYPPAKVKELLNA